MSDQQLSANTADSQGSAKKKALALISVQEQRNTEKYIEEDEKIEIIQREERFRSKPKAEAEQILFIIK